MMWLVNLIDWLNATGPTLASFWLVAVVTMLSVVTYILPTLIAFDHKHPQKIAICALNLLLGWTLLGWVGAFVWALTKQRTHYANR